ncbi:MAG: site-specific DNA-methyltransferase [Sporolactobacillus sp.]
MADQQDIFEFDKLPPIKGFPELRWTNKRPYRTTMYYPAQLKETYGKADENGWINKIFWGDNLQVMSHLLKEYRGAVDLIYIDPPFDSKADYKKKVKIKVTEEGKDKNKTVTNDSLSFEEKQYGDIWINDEYLQFMYERLILLRELLSEKGSIYVHLDEHKSHYIRLILDEVFGQAGFRREIIWDITVLSGFKVQAMNWIRGHDTIFYYSKTSNPTFNKLRQPHTRKYIDMFNRVDENGDRYLVAHGKTRYLKDVINKGKPYGDVWDDLTSYQILRKQLDEVSNMDELSELLTETKGVQNISNVWDNIMSFQQQPTAAENVGYPTQKPETLLKRIIEASSDEGDLIFDCFMGSGTTQSVAAKLNRRYIGADINLGSVQTTTKRLLNEMESAESKVGFEVYNVNDYDFFRNELEAKQLIIDALEIQAMAASNIYDGELDGRMVKIMPTNRITTKADLSELIANLPYDIFAKRKEDSPSEPVERITIVCMGHEPDLKASFLKEVGDYKLDVEIVDILKDKKALQLKRDSEGSAVIRNGEVIIESFFPMNLLQKLSLDEQNVEDWKQLVESVMIDFNYDGAVLNPSEIDIPEKNELVKGVYDIPEGAGTIRIKITDVLSESLEIEAVK